MLYWTQAWDSNKGTHSQVANHILCFQCIYLKKKKDLTSAGVPVLDENWGSLDEHLGSRSGATCHWPQA